MAEWRVEQEDGASYLSGPNTHREWLFHRLDAGDISTSIEDPETMHNVLYDEYQCNEFMKDGDTIVTPVGTFYCYSFHVLSQMEFDKVNS